MSIMVQYLHHSGVSVKTHNHFLVFDYDGIPKNYSQPFKENNTIVFVSHRHNDHFTPEIFSWKDKNPSLEIVLSSDVPQKKGCHSIHPDKTLKLEETKISTLESTDEGVAFLVKTDGISIYHAGDLNWWHWNGESSAYNKDMEQRYRHEIEKMRGMQIDFAFVPLDPRLDDAYKLGLDFFARTVDVKTIFPIHLWENYGLIKKLKSDPNARNYANRIMEISAPGQIFSFDR